MPQDILKLGAGYSLHAARLWRDMFPLEEAERIANGVASPEDIAAMRLACVRGALLGLVYARNWADYLEANGL